MNDNVTWQCLKFVSSSERTYILFLALTLPYIMYFSLHPTYADNVSSINLQTLTEIPNLFVYNERQQKTYSE